MPFLEVFKFRQYRLGSIAGACAAITVLSAWTMAGLAGAQAAAFGLAVAMVYRRLLIGRLGTCAAAHLSPGRVAVRVGVGAVERFLLVPTGIALGLGHFHLAPLPLLAGFAAPMLLPIPPAAD